MSHPSIRLNILQVIILIFIIVISFKLYMYYWLEFLLVFFNVCSLGSMSISLNLEILLLMRITMRGNHVLVAGSVRRHYLRWPIVSTWISWHQMLFARYLMVITMLSNNLISFHYFLDILDGVPLLLDTNQRVYYNSLVIFSPFLHSLLLHLYPQRRLIIDDLVFLIPCTSWRDL